VNGIELSILIPAMIAGLLVISTHVPLGQVVLKRGIIFIDLAIAQIAGLGVIAAHLLFHDPNHWTVQLTAVSFALLGALLLRWTEKRWLPIQEALIGALFVLSASLSVLLLADNPHGGEQLKDILSGQILWVSSSQLIDIALVYAVLLALWFGIHRLRRGGGFYLLFAVAVTLSVQLVGVYLVFSSLIMPALATHRLQDNKSKLLFGYLTGVLGYAAGLLLSSLTDLPSGPMIVVCLIISALLVAVLIRHR
jgi:zinc/manganese transport system permease protein